MKNKTKKQVSILNNKYISQKAASLKYKPIKKEVTFKKKLQSVKVFIASGNENALYTLRNNKVIEKKQANKKHNSKRFFKKPLSNIRNKANEVLLTHNNEKLPNLNGDNHADDENDKMKINMSYSKINDLYNHPNNESNEMNNSHSMSRSHMDACSKLKIIDLYDKLKSFNDISAITGINSQTIRYWKKTEDSIKEVLFYYYFISLL